MKILAFLNAYSQGLSGGDACFLNVVSALGKTEDLTIVTSKLGEALCKKRCVKATFVITSHEKKFKNIITTYLQRTFLAVVLACPPKGCILYSSSDFLPDVLPAFFFRMLHQDRLWVQKIFHLIPTGRPLVYFLQKVSLLLIKISADLVIVDNDTLGGDLVTKYSFQEEKIHVIPPGLDVDEVKQAPKLKEKFDGIFAGQLRKSKGIFDLIPVWKVVMERFPDARLGIIGEDVQGNQKLLKGEVRRGGLSKNIKILGFIQENAAVFSLLKSSKVLLLPSYEEGFGMVAIESLAAGAPVVAYDLPVYRANFGNTINVVPVGDKGAFAKKIIEILGMKRKRRKQYGNMVKRFDTITVVGQEVDLIKYAYQSPR